MGSSWFISRKFTCSNFNHCVLSFFCLPVQFPCIFVIFYLCLIFSIAVFHPGLFNLFFSGASFNHTFFCANSCLIHHAFKQIEYVKKEKQSIPCFASWKVLIGSTFNHVCIFIIKSNIFASHQSTLWTQFWITIWRSKGDKALLNKHQKNKTRHLFKNGLTNQNWPIHTKICLDIQKKVMEF